LSSVITDDINCLVDFVAWHAACYTTQLDGIQNEDFVMISRRDAFTVALTVLLGVAVPAAAASGPIARLDSDNDGTVDLDEAKKAASALFDKLDTDNDGTLDLKELKGRVTDKEFKAADPDKDGTLSKDEYLALVEKRFKAADPDSDGTVSAAEFKAHAGLSLIQLLY
jgi:Ca2+-binding EF-hand superfamily protein